MTIIFGSERDLVNKCDGVQEFFSQRVALSCLLFLDQQVYIIVDIVKLKVIQSEYKMVTERFVRRNTNLVMRKFELNNINIYDDNNK